MLRALKLRHDPQEDRLVLTVDYAVGDQPHTEQLLLTRRISSAWRQVLQKMVEHSAAAPAEMAPDQRAHIQAGHHAAMAARAIRAVESAPTGPQACAGARLVARIDCGATPGAAGWTVRFTATDGTQLTLNLGAPTLHGFIDAFNDRVLQAQWGIPPLITPPAKAPPAELQTKLH